MLPYYIIRVLSVHTLYPRRVHYMNADGEVLCDNKHLKFCLEEAHPGYVPHIRVCAPCQAQYTRLIRQDDKPTTDPTAYTSLFSA